LRKRQRSPNFPATGRHRAARPKIFRKLSINPDATTGIKTSFAKTDKGLSVPEPLFLFVQVLPSGEVFLNGQ
jgi:hypothetical protein